MEACKGSAKINTRLSQRKEKDMKHRKITALIFAISLGFTFLTACTKQSNDKDAAPTAAESSEIQSESEKSCCNKEESCCVESKKTDCCKEEENSNIPDCCAG